MSEHTTADPGPSSAGGDTRPVVRPGAKALISSSDRVLLVRERHGDGTPFWTLPGGGRCREESPRQALHRELREELDCRCLVTDRVTEFLYSHLGIDAVSVYEVFECTLLSEPRAMATAGVLDIQWIRPEDPPARTLLGVEELLGSVDL